METQDKIRILNSIPLFAKLSETELDLVASLAQHRRMAKYQFVYMPDEPSEHFYILTKGRLKTGSFAMDGREVIKELLQPLALFGDLCLAGEERRADYAQVLYDEGEFLSIRIADFQQLMQQNQTLMFAAMQHLSARLQRVEERLSSLILKDARERIIEFLLETADKEGRKVGYETLVKHRLTQQDIANLTGTSRQTVTSVLNDLKKNNQIYFNRNTILIRDVDNLN